MAADRLKQTSSSPPANSGRPQGSGTPPGRSRRKTLWFRLLAVLGVPLLLVGLTECGLRLAGYGYPTAFLFSPSHNDQAVWRQNNRFGWRFFGRDMARWPCPLLLPQSKATNTIRIFVFGESAARGEPQPDFGLSRILQAMLSLEYPGVQFEVVNTAMTAINSHAILPIARDCSRANGDLWVIYMGNNEVVGPFGAGTVFGPRSLPLPLIRASLVLKSTRTGQLLDAMERSFQAASRDDSVWGGMTLFLNQQVRKDYAQLDRVYQNFEHNLQDILRLGQAAGVPVVLSTVAVNLRDCAPFASAHRADLAQADRANWEENYRQGITAQAAGNLQEAAARFAAAARIDDTYAELRFRQGQIALALGRQDEAREQLQAACDLDTLRFRCDSRLNDLVREAATDPANGGVILADAEEAFRKHSPEGVPGAELFYEHVHLTFKGNYFLARTITEQLVTQLPEWVGTRRDANAPWPSLAECAQRLGYTEWHQAAALHSMLATLADPPFTAQLGHAAQMLRLEQELARLSSAQQPEGLARAVETCAAALELSPNDPILHRQLASLKKASGDLAGAEAAARHQVERLPNDPEGWALLGSILAQKREFAEAETAFRRAFEAGPQGIQSMLDLAGALAALNRPEEAIAAYRRILQRRPRCVPAWLRLGQLSEALGDKAAAEDCFRQVLTHRSERLPELMELAAFFQSRGALDAAIEVGNDALRLNPSDARLHVWTGRNLASLGRYEAAEPHSAEAVRLAPDLVEARLLHGIVLWKQGRASEAVAEFEEALRLQPDSMDAQLNLGLVMAQRGRRAEALDYFHRVLRQSPTNALALKHLQALQGDQSQGANTK